MIVEDGKIYYLDDGSETTKLIGDFTKNYPRRGFHAFGIYTLGFSSDLVDFCHINDINIGVISNKTSGISGPENYIYKQKHFKSNDPFDFCKTKNLILSYQYKVYNGTRRGRVIGVLSLSVNGFY
jgi:hypothetical protein